VVNKDSQQKKTWFMSLMYSIFTCTAKWDPQRRTAGKLPFTQHSDYWTWTSASQRWVRPAGTNYPVYSHNPLHVSATKRIDDVAKNCLRATHYILL